MPSTQIVVKLTGNDGEITSRGALIREAVGTFAANRKLTWIYMLKGYMEDGAGHSVAKIQLKFF